MYAVKELDHSCGGVGDCSCDTERDKRDRDHVTPAQSTRPPPAQEEQRHYVTELSSAGHLYCRSLAPGHATPAAARVCKTSAYTVEVGLVVKATSLGRTEEVGPRPPRQREEACTALDIQLLPCILTVGLSTASVCLYTPQTTVVNHVH